MNLEQAQLERRSKELDAREAFIDAKAKILENGPITLKVYDQRVKYSEERLDELSKQIKVNEDLLSNQVTELEEYRVKKERILDNHQKQVNDIKDKIRGKEQKYEDISQSIIQVSALLHERQNYLEEQESIIDQAVQTGNDKLLDLNDKISRLDSEVATRKQELYELEKRYEDMVIQYDDTKIQYESIIDQLLDKKANLDSETDEQMSRISSISAEYNVVKSEINKKMAVLKEKETSILAKRDALALERQELETDKRRWNATKDLYDL